MEDAVGVPVLISFCGENLHHVKMAIMHPGYDSSREDTQQGYSASYVNLDPKHPDACRLLGHALLDLILSAEDSWPAHSNAASRIIERLEL